jgi:tRNA(fMet)-specific endonuclease VapC
MARYLLDTNILSDLIRSPDGNVARKIAATGEEHVCTSVVVACELRFGARKKNAPALTARVDSLLKSLEVLPLEPGTDRVYAEVRAALEARGQTIGLNECLIAAHALAWDCILVTDNVEEFSRVPDLLIRNWRIG